MTNRAFEQLLNSISKRPVLVVVLSVLWLTLIGGIAFFWHLGSVGLIDETEPLFAEASRQMYLTGDWITPYFNDLTRFDKPALIYWCQAIAYSIIGVNEWAVRIPSAIAAMAVISLAFYTVQWQLAKQDSLEQTSHPPRRWLTAGLVAAVMALNPEMIVWGRTGVSDMLLTGCIGSALLCFFLGYAREGSGKVEPLVGIRGNGDRGQGGHINSKYLRKPRSVYKIPTEAAERRQNWEESGQTNQSPINGIWLAMC